MGARRSLRVDSAGPDVPEITIMSRRPMNYRQILILRFILMALGCLGVYLGSYFMIVSAVPPNLMFGCCSWHGSPSYRLGGAVSEVVFAPLVQLDQRIRPEHWKFTVDDIAKEHRYRP